jgi:hypothetical protein
MTLQAFNTPYVIASRLGGVAIRIPKNPFTKKFRASFKLTRF